MPTSVADRWWSRWRAWRLFRVTIDRRHIGWSRDEVPRRLADQTSDALAGQLAVQLPLGLSPHFLYDPTKPAWWNQEARRQLDAATVPVRVNAVVGEAWRRVTSDPIMPLWFLADCYAALLACDQMGRIVGDDHPVRVQRQITERVFLDLVQAGPVRGGCTGAENQPVSAALLSVPLR